MAQPRQRRGAKQGKGGGSGASWLGALLGGGGENPEFKGAASEVASGTLSSPGEAYDPRAATSAKGVLTPELQSAFNAGPNKPLNWLGKATGQPDYYSQWQSTLGQSALNAQTAQQLSAIDEASKIKLEAIRHSNTSDEIKQKGAIDEHNIAAQQKAGVLAKAGVLQTPENETSYDTATSPLVAQLAPEAVRSAMASQGIQNALQQAQTNRMNYFELSPGSGVLPISQLGNGVSAVLDKPPTIQEQMMAKTMGLELPGANTFQFSKNGQPFGIRPKTSVSTTPMESFGYPYNPVGGNPGAFTVPGPAVVPPAQPLQPSVAPSNPSAFMQGSIASGARGLMSGLQSLWNNQIGGAAQKAPEVTPAPMLQDDQAALLRAAQEEQQRRMWLTPRLSPMFGY